MPPTAEKYKLYKKLSKAQVAPNQSQPIANPPRTPPRRPAKLSESSAVVPKSRPTHSTVASSSNPFSPVKTPRRQPISPNDAPFGMPNFHVSPFRPSKAHSPSLDTEAHATSTADPSSRTGRAFSKARKRLRGDSVSPSPKKPRVSTLRLSEDNDELEEDNSFVDESPVKATTGGKNFITLFEEERIPAPNFSGNARPTNKVASTSNGAKRRLVFPSQSKDSKQIPSSSRPPDAASEIPSGEPDLRASDATST